MSNIVKTSKNPHIHKAQQILRKKIKAEDKLKTSGKLEKTKKQMQRYLKNEAPDRVSLKNKTVQKETSDKKAKTHALKILTADITPNTTKTKKKGHLRKP